MNRTTRWALWILAAAVAPIASHVARTEGAHSPTPQDAQESNAFTQVKCRYSPGGMYLTYKPLRDLWLVTKDPVKFHALREKPPGKELLDRWAKYLQDLMSEVNLSKSVAFVHLNLDTLILGHKLVSDSDATLTKAGFLGEEVGKLAVFCDASLVANQAFEEALARTKSGGGTLKSSWNDLQRFDVNPYIPAGKIADYVRELRERIERSPEEFERLHQEDPKLFESIKQFRSDFDRQLKTPESEVLRRDEKVLFKEMIDRAERLGNNRQILNRNALKAFWGKEAPRIEGYREPTFGSLIEGGERGMGGFSLPK